MKLRLMFPTAALMIVVACSGATETELFAPAGTTDGTSPSSTGDDDGSSGGTDTSSSSSSGSSGTSSGSTSSSSGSTTKKDAGTTPPKDSGTPPPPPSGTPIYCGEKNGVDTTCPSDTEVCCGTFGNGTPKFECKSTGSTCSLGATRISCDDRTDCPNNQICCGLLVDGVGYSTIECKTSCQSAPGVRAVHFCDPNAAVDECLDYGGVCIPSQSVPGFHVCGQ